MGEEKCPQPGRQFLMEPKMLREKLGSVVPWCGDQGCAGSQEAALLPCRICPAPEDIWLLPVSHTAQFALYFRIWSYRVDLLGKSTDFH